MGAWVFDCWLVFWCLHGGWGGQRRVWLTASLILPRAHVVCPVNLSLSLSEVSLAFSSVSQGYKGRYKPTDWTGATCYSPYYCDVTSWWLRCPWATVEGLAFCCWERWPCLFKHQTKKEKKTFWTRFRGDAAVYSANLHAFDHKILNPWNLAIWLHSAHLDAQSALNDSPATAFEGSKGPLFMLLRLHTVHVHSTLNS